jgi:hypothetical protein
MAAADTNVRPTRRVPAATAHGARRSVLARLLLLQLFRPLQLYRKLFFLLAISLMPSCIIPVGPEFQDPDGTPNAAPRISDPDPGFGEEVTALDQWTFQLTIGDPNAVDHLYVKWIADYPPLNDLTRSSTPTPYAPPGDGKPIQQPIDFAIACNDLNHSSSRHRIMAVVADRPFVNTVPGNLLVVEPPGQFAVATWVLTLTSCPLQ